MERNVCRIHAIKAWSKPGRNWGTLQVIADVFKLLLKESFSPTGLISFFSIWRYYGTFRIFNVTARFHGLLGFNVGHIYRRTLLWLFMLWSWYSYGWLVSNKSFTLLGAMRSGAQIALELSAGYYNWVIGVRKPFCSDLFYQGDGWWIFKGIFNYCLV